MHIKMQFPPQHRTRGCNKLEDWVSVFLQYFSVWLELISGSLDSLGANLGSGHHSLVVCSGTNSSLLLQLSDHLSILPSNRFTKISQSSELATRTKVSDTKSIRDNKSLHFVIWWWNTNKTLQATHSSGTTSSLVGNHASDSATNKVSRRSVMEWTLLGVGVGALLTEGFPFQLVPEQLTRNVHIFTSNKNH